MDLMQLTTVIPSVGLNGMLATCISALRVSMEAAGISNHRIVVVDNATPFPYLANEFGSQVDILRFDTPQSFSRACNAGADLYPGTDLLFLNNDVFLHRDAIIDIVETRKAFNAQITGARLVFTSGEIQHCGVSVDGKSLRPFHARVRNPSHKVSRVHWNCIAVTGAVMLIDRDCFDAVGGFDEIYPFAYEDVDLCLRARELGYRIACAQKVDSLHLTSVSPGRFTHEAASRTIFENRWRGRLTTDVLEGFNR